MRARILPTTVLPTCILRSTLWADVPPAVQVEGRMIDDGVPGKIARQPMARFKKLARS